MTEEDSQKLQTCGFDRNTGDYPKDAVHLFAEIFYVKKHNDNILSQLPGEKVSYHVMTMLYLLTFLLKSARS